MEKQPPVRGFWSPTLYNEHHFFHPNELDRYSFGTKIKNLHRAGDGSLTLTRLGRAMAPAITAGRQGTGSTCESTWPQRVSSPYRSRDGSSYARHLRTSPRAVLLALLSSFAGEPAGPGTRCAVGDESCTSWIWEAPDCVMEGTVGNR